MLLHCSNRPQCSLKSLKKKQTLQTIMQDAKVLHTTILNRHRQLNITMHLVLTLHDTIICNIKSRHLWFLKQLLAEIQLDAVLHVLYLIDFFHNSFCKCIIRSASTGNVVVNSSTTDQPALSPLLRNYSGQARFPGLPNLWLFWSAIFTDWILPVM